jgi:hypothetical protein
MIKIYQAYLAGMVHDGTLLGVLLLSMCTGLLVFLFVEALVEGEKFRRDMEAIRRGEKRPKK